MKICIDKKHNIFLLLILLGIYLYSCTERNRENPFASNGKNPISINIKAFDRNIELSWNKPDLYGFMGYNLYRSEDGGDNYIKLKELLPSQTSYIDTIVEFRKKYYYNIKIVGHGIESVPTNTVSIVPGPGLNWIVDYNGYQIIKTTYDLQHIIVGYLTNWRPLDIAIAKSLGYGLGICEYSNVIEKFDLITGDFIEGISNNLLNLPKEIEYDSLGSNFWLLDYGGNLYRMNAGSGSLSLIDSTLEDPAEIEISPNTGYINIVDREAKKILQYNREGVILNEISSINGDSLKNPEKYLYDENNNREWLIDGDSLDYIYTKLINESDFTKIDSFPNAGDMVLDRNEDSIWIISLVPYNSSIMKLSSSGIRQIVLSGDFDEPSDLVMNKYDNSLLVADPYPGKVFHYNNEELLGSLRLNTPFKVIIE